MDKDQKKTHVSSSDDKDTQPVKSREVCEEIEPCTSDNESGQGTSGTAEKSSGSASQNSDSTSGIDLKGEAAAAEESPLLPEVIIDPPSVAEDSPVKEERKGFRSWLRRSLSPKKPERSSGSFTGTNKDLSPEERGKKSSSFFRKKSRSPNKKEHCLTDNQPILQSDELEHSSSDEGGAAPASKNLGAIPKKKLKSKATSPNKPDEPVSGRTRRFSDSLVRRAQNLIPNLPTLKDKTKKERMAQEEEISADKSQGAIPKESRKSPNKQDEPAATGTSRRFSDSVVRCAQQLFPGLSTLTDKPKKEKEIDGVPQVKGKVTRVKSKKIDKKDQVVFSREPAAEGEIGRWGTTELVFEEEPTASASSVNLDSMSSYKFANFSDANFSDFSDLPDDTEKEVRDASEQMSKSLGFADPDDTDSSGESMYVNIDLTGDKPSVKEYHCKKRVKSEAGDNCASGTRENLPDPGPRAKKIAKLVDESTGKIKADIGVQTEEIDETDIDLQTEEFNETDSDSEGKDLDKS